MQLTEHFSLSEFTYSATATVKGIDNTPTDTAIVNMLCLCQHTLEPLRQWYGRPITISSGYRCNAVNVAVGGARTSQHLTGEAADITPPRTSPQGRRLTPAEQLTELQRLYDYVSAHLPFDQLILERTTSASTTYWLHISCRRNIASNRRQCIPLMNKSQCKNTLNL